MKSRKILRGPLPDGTSVDRKWSDGGYVEVPKEMLRQAGFDHGQKVKLFCKPDGVVEIIRARFDADAVVHWARLCLRLWKGAVRRAGLRVDGEKVTFIYRNKAIEVRTT